MIGVVGPAQQAATALSQVIAAYIGVGLTIFLGLIAVTWRLGKLEQRVHDMTKVQEKHDELILEVLRDQTK